jgi:hypothetical protein
MEQVVELSEPDTEHERVTLAEYPAKPATVIVSVTGDPRVIVKLAVCAVTAKSGLVGPFQAAASAPASTDPRPVAKS